MNAGIAVILSTVSLLVGFMLGLLGDAIRRRWARADAEVHTARQQLRDQRTRSDVRTEEAAQELAKILPANGPPPSDMLYQMQVVSRLLANPEVRSRVARYLDLIGDLEISAQRAATTTDQLGHEVMELLNNAIAAVLSGEPLRDDARFRALHKLLLEGRLPAAGPMSPNTQGSALIVVEALQHLRTRKSSFVAACRDALAKAERHGYLRAKPEYGQAWDAVDLLLAFGALEEQPYLPNSWPKFTITDVGRYVLIALTSETAQ